VLPSDAPEPTVVVRRVRQMAGYSSDGFSSSFELVATPMLFIGLGHLVDRWVGTTWVFAVVFGMFAVAGTFAKQWFVYDARMTAQEENLRNKRANEADAAAARRAESDAALTAEREELQAHLAASRPTDAFDASILGMGAAS
jgi:hypothetical protein